MQKSFLLACCLFSALGVGAQNNVSAYADAIKKAETLYDSKDFKNSGLAYSKAFSAHKKANESDRYNAACSWSLAKVADSSFVQLQKIGKEGYANYDHVIQDTDLDNLHSDKRWKPWLDQVKSNQEKALAKIDHKLKNQLEQVLKDDQDLRKQLPELEKKYGLKSDEVKKQWDLIEEKDKINLNIVTKLLDEKGFPTQDVVGGTAVTAVFLVIQHSDQKTREKYMPMFREAALKGELPNSSYALLKDRTDLGQGKKQTFGSQIMTDANTGKSFVRPLEDPENVDKRRAEVGLDPISNYVKRWNITWDAKQYIKDLPEIEALDKKLFSKK